jgi:LPS-assembly protein
VDLPFYWAISDATDATFYAHYMSKRGLMSGGEFRYAASEESKGVMRFDYLDDQAQTDTLRAEGFREVTPGFSGDYHNRWWWRSKQDFVLPDGVLGKMDLDFVSDRDYLREFQTGFGTFNESNRMFEGTFGRGLVNDDTVTTRESSLQFSKTWGTQFLNADFHYFENLDRTQDETTLQQLPSLSYSASRQRFFGGPFFYQADASYVDYWRPEGTRGHRLDLQPRLDLPLRWGQVDVDPSAGVRETAYLIEDYDEPEGSSIERKRFQSRELYDLRLATSTELMRVFHTDGEGGTAIKHTVKPEIDYEYIPTQDQETLPSFDGTDRIAGVNLITYSVTNFFVARLPHEPGKFSYLDLARVKLSQSYDLNEAKREVSADSLPRRPFSNVSLEVDLTPQNYLDLTYRGEWSPYDGSFKRNDVQARLWTPRGDSLGIDYRQQLGEPGQTPLNEIDGTLSAQLWGGFSFHFREDYSFTLGQNLESDYLIELKRQCWGLSFSYVDKPDDRRFMIGFTLYGVGEVQPQGIGY